MSRHLYLADRVLRCAQDFSLSFAKGTIWDGAKFLSKVVPKIIASKPRAMLLDENPVNVWRVITQKFVDISFT
jgi:hypothetical protein